MVYSVFLCFCFQEKYGPKGQGKALNGGGAKPNKDSKQQPDFDITVGLSKRFPWFCRYCFPCSDFMIIFYSHACSDLKLINVMNFLGNACIFLLNVCVHSYCCCCPLKAMVQIAKLVCFEINASSVVDMKHGRVGEETIHFDIVILVLPTITNYLHNKICMIYY